MKVIDLKSKIDELKEAQETINLKREEWQKSTKPTLIRVLTELKETYKVGWHVQVLDRTRNSEGVNITFGLNHSGISEKTDKSHKYYIKRGGTIVFSQAYNGDIFVIIIYPSVDELVGESENKLLGRFEPKDIQDKFILEKVSIFIDELIKWEKTTYGGQIGFK